MHRMTPFSWRVMALALLALGLGLLLLPEDFSEPIRRSVRDVARPGQFLTVSVAGWCRGGWQAVQDWQVRRADLIRIQAELKQERERGRETQSRLAHVQRQLHDTNQKLLKKVESSPSEPLFIPELIEARVLGQEVLELHQGRKLLGVGASQGVGENLLVVDPLRPTLDVGQDLGLTVHSPVFAGQAVVGRTINCGGYSCSLQSVTDAKFSGVAQVMRRTSVGLQPGPEGVVEGTGLKTCRLTGIWRREPIEVGDEVYTPSNDPLLPYQMFYGTVIRTELPEGAAHWIIELAPAASDLRLTHVQVLKPKENPLRVMAN